MLELNSDTAVH